MYRIGVLALAVILTLPPAVAHENEDPTTEKRGFINIMEDCDDDYGWHADNAEPAENWPENGELGHDHEVLEFVEDTEDGQHLVIFHMVMTNRDKDPELLEPPNDAVTLDTLSFSVDGVVYTTTIWSDDHEDEEEFQYHSGEEPAHMERNSVLLEGGGEDEWRFGIELGYTYQQLSAQNGSVVDDWSTLGDWEGSTEPYMIDDGYECHVGEGESSSPHPPGEMSRRNGIALTPEPPTVSVVTEPMTVERGEPVSFDATASEGAAPVAAWEWDFKDGDTADVQSPTHTFDGLGTFDVKVTVTDDLGSPATDSVLIVVENAPPVAAFTFEPSAPVVDEPVQFQDTSTDDTNITSWQWDLGDGTTSTERHPDHTYTEPDDQVKVTLTVTDDDGATATKERFLQVRADEEEEIIEFTEGPTAAFDIGGDPTAGEEVTFIDRSTDPDDGIVAWAWDFGDGGTSTEQDPTHTYVSAGNFTVTLTVTDAGGLEATTSQNLEILEAQQDEGDAEPVRPVADFEVEPVPDSGGQTYRFHDRSTHPAGEVVAWAWTFGDGTTSTEASPEHTYRQFGPFTVRLVVTDAVGLKDAAFQLVTVVAPDEGDNESPVPVGAALTAVGAALFLARRNRRP